MVDLEPVQNAVVAALIEAPATYPLYDAVPQGSAYPYLALGAITQVPDVELIDDDDGIWACVSEFEDVMEDPSSTAESRLFHGVARYRLMVDGVSSATVTIHAWSDTHGKYEAQRMLKFVRDRLHNQNIN